MHCQTCSTPLDAQRATRRFCSPACRQKGYRQRIAARCHQRKVRDRMAEADPRPQMTTLDGCRVEVITEAEARPIVRVYEWLGTVGVPSICVGLRDPGGELIGVTLFGHPGSPEAGRILDVPAQTLCLTRGACVHWAHPHAASYLISRAVKLSGAAVVYAYSDPEAGEVGTVYQACNWLYLGRGVGRGKNSGRPRFEKLIDPSGREWSARSLRHLGLTIKEARDLGWTAVMAVAKHKYVWLADKRLAKHLRYPVLPYPKRT